MRAELIVIGDELLIGQIVDTNSNWMCSRLNEIGVQVKQISVISDGKDDIINALSLATARADVILMTGGLGPTKDDVTKEALVEYFKSELVLDKDVAKHVEQIFAKYKRSMPPENIKQAEVLRIAEVLFNKAGTAPGMWIKQQDKYFAIMPGVPTEMKYLMESEVLPRLKSLPGRKVLIHKNILTAGLGESFLAERIAHIENNLPPYIKLAYLPSFAQVRLRLSAEGMDEAVIQNQLDFYSQSIRSSIVQHYVNDNEQTLEETLLTEMGENQLTLAVAESCTGGNISHLLTQVPGSSQAFLGGVISYSNEVKVTALGVKQQTLDNFGAVCEQTAVEMAQGVKEKIRSNYSIAVTGIAGPGGGSVEKPVGTVWIAIAGMNKTNTYQFMFGKRRYDNISRASKEALYLLLHLVREENEGK